MKLIKIISVHKRLKKSKIVVLDSGALMEVPVPKLKLGFQRVEAIMQDFWGQKWTKHVDIKK